MPRRKRRTRRRNETLVRFVAINAVSAGTSISTEQERGAEPQLSSTSRIELTGTMDEPIRDTRELRLSCMPLTTRSPDVTRRRGLASFMGSAGDDRLRCRGSVARAAARARLDRVRGQAASGSIQRTFVGLAVSPSSAIPAGDAIPTVPIRVIVRVA